MEIFDIYYRRYDEWYEKPFGKSAYELELSCLRKIIPEFNKGIEIGVGTGRFATKLNVKFGIDISFNMLKFSKERGLIVVKAKGERLPFKDNSFDFVLIVVSLCFVKDPFLVLKEAHRILTDNGKIVLGLILSDSPWAEYYKKKKDHPIYKQAMFYSFYEVQTMLELSRFKIDKVLTTLFEEPQEEKPISSFEIKEGFHRDGGFFCIRALKL
jgi:ubiquinone/menaquinone biosynthesis C-methylase UbiE